MSSPQSSSNQTSTSTILSALKTTATPTQANNLDSGGGLRIDLNKKPIFELILDALAHNRSFINLGPSVVHQRKKVNLFPDFYDNYDYEGLGKSPGGRLLPAPTGLEYDGSVLVDSNSSSSIFGDYDGTGSGQMSAAAAASSSPLSSQDGQSSSIFGQFSTPIVYILCMLLLYAIIIFVVFISALYSHRKRIGYNFDETLDGGADSSQMADELDSNVHYKSFYDDEDGESEEMSHHHAAARVDEQQRFASKRSLKSNRIKRKKPARRSRHLNSKASLDLSKNDDDENKQLVQDGFNSEPEDEKSPYSRPTERCLDEDECCVAVATSRKRIKLISTPPKPSDSQIYARPALTNQPSETIRPPVEEQQPASVSVFERLFKLLPSNGGGKMSSSSCQTKDHTKSADRAGFSLLSSSELSKVHSLQADNPPKFLHQDQKSWLNECKF